MLLNMTEFAKKISVKSFRTLYVYLCRPEFNHIKKIKKADNTILYCNVKEVDILRLKLLTHRRSLTFKEKAQLSNKIRKLYAQGLTNTSKFDSIAMRRSCELQ